MKISDAVHATPWWALFLGGVAVIGALAVFVTPFHLIEYRRDGGTPEERKAIKREVDNTFAEGAMDIARSTILAMRGATSDPARRAELDRALEELDSARDELRDAGREIARAKRRAVEAAHEAAGEAARSVEEARRSAERALAEAGIESEKVQRALEQSAKAAREAEEEAKKALKDGDGAKGSKRIVIDVDVGKDRAPGEAGPGVPGPATVPAPPGVPAPPAEPGTPAPPGVAVAPLPPELRAKIRENVSADLRKIGVGAGLILIFLPLFLVVAIAKFFIDRSRAAQRQADLKKKEAEFHRLSQQVTEAKLMALQAQVEPHFLYNTLASVQALTEVDPARANTMVGHLIQYLRNALPKMRESISTVGQEIELVRAYLNILQMRMGRRLSFEISVPESLLATPFPPLMLPSLVENAIKHGLEPQREGGAVLITAQATGGRLRLIVSDTGRGFGEAVGAGVGLANIRERLHALYGETAKLTLESNSPSGVIATIEVPLDGLHPAAALPPGAPGAAAAAVAPTATDKVLSAVGTAERAWRKSLTFTFNALVIVAAVVAGLAMFGVMTGVMPVQVNIDSASSASGMHLGVVGIAVGFAVVVLVLAIVIAVVYGLGWLFAGLAVFIPLAILVALLPALAPVVLLGLLVWWLVRRQKAKAAAPVPKVEPVMQPPGEPPAASPKEPPPAV